MKLKGQGYRYMKIFTPQYQEGKPPFLNLERAVHKLACPTQSKLRLGWGSYPLEDCRFCGKC